MILKKRKRHVVYIVLLFTLSGPMYPRKITRMFSKAKRSETFLAVFHIDN